MAWNKLLHESDPTASVQFASLNIATKVILADGATVGQVAGPLMTFDDTNNWLGITGCKAAIGNRATFALSPRAFNLIATDAAVHIRRHHDSFAPTIELVSYDGGGTVLASYWDFYTGTSTYLPGCFVIRDRTITDNNRFVIDTTGKIGIGTTNPGRTLEINSATGINLRLTYNASTGSAVNYVDYLVSSIGNGTITPSGGLLTLTGNLLITTIKSGATQSAAGAGTNELWKTSGHATLPDNVVMHGV